MPILDDSTAGPVLRLDLSLVIIGLIGSARRLSSSHPLQPSPRRLYRVHRLYRLNILIDAYYNEKALIFCMCCVRFSVQSWNNPIYIYDDFVSLCQISPE